MSHRITRLSAAENSRQRSDPTEALFIRHRCLVKCNQPKVGYDALNWRQLDANMQMKNRNENDRIAHSEHYASPLRDILIISLYPHPYGYKMKTEDRTFAQSERNGSQSWHQKWHFHFSPCSVSDKYVLNIHAFMIELCKTSIYFPFHQIVFTSGCLFCD